MKVTVGAWGRVFKEYEIPDDHPNPEAEAKRLAERECEPAGDWTCAPKVPLKGWALHSNWNLRDVGDYAFAHDDDVPF